MANQDQRTEQPTQQKLRKAREEGRFPVSREFVAAVQFGVFTALLTGTADSWWPPTARAAQEMLLLPFTAGGSLQSIQQGLLGSVAPLGVGLLIAGAMMTGASLLTQLASTGFGLAPARLAPDASRLNPLNNLRELPRKNRSALLEAVFLLPIMLLISWIVISDRLSEFIRLPLLSLNSGARVVGSALSELLCKAAGAFLVWGVVDLFRQRRRYDDGEPALVSRAHRGSSARTLEPWPLRHKMARAVTATTT